MYDIEKLLLPEFPRTKHLGIEPNATSDDMVASEEETQEFLQRGNFIVEEKLDGANCGMRLERGNAIIRNRTHILNKAYGNAKTPAKQQFASVWTWFYEHKKCFEALERLVGFTPSVYGEWLLARHTIEYTALPDWFIAFDIYNPQDKQFLEPVTARSALCMAGFRIPHKIEAIYDDLPSELPLKERTPVEASKVLALRDGPSFYNPHTAREGIYLRGGFEEGGVYRYKMVAPWFTSDPDWVKQPLVKNKKVSS